MKIELNEEEISRLIYWAWVIEEEWGSLFFDEKSLILIEKSVKWLYMAKKKHLLEELEKCT